MPLLQRGEWCPSLYLAVLPESSSLLSTDEATLGVLVQVVASSIQKRHECAEESSMKGHEDEVGRASVL